MADDPVSTTPEPAELVAFIHETQAILWYDLEQALRRASNGVWSVEACNKAQWIVKAARLVGPSRVGEIPWDLVSGGVYEAVLTAGAVPFELPDAAEMQRLNMTMIKYASRDLRATVSAIQSPRETAYILDESEAS